MNRQAEGGSDDEKRGRCECNTAGSSRRRRETAELLRLCQSMTAGSPLPIIAVDGPGHIARYVNPAFCCFAGKTNEELVGKSFAEAVPGGGHNGCLALLERVYIAGTGGSLADQEHLSSGPPPVYWSYVMWVIFTPDGRAAGIIIQITDTTEAVLLHRKMLTVSEALLLSGVRQHELTEATERINVRLQALADTDGLTGLKNHRAFQERLREEVQRAARYDTPLSLLMLDVDDFKSYNDVFGHPAGDAALRKIGAVLQATARTHDLIARYGGEEFAVILPETDAKNALIAAERFRAAVEAADWRERQITVSSGAATLALTVCDALALIAAADAALYQSKERGRNCVTRSREVAHEGGADAEDA